MGAVFEEKIGKGRGNKQYEFRLMTRAWNAELLPNDWKWMSIVSVLMNQRESETYQSKNSVSFKQPKKKRQKTTKNLHTKHQNKKTLFLKPFLPSESLLFIKALDGSNCLKTHQGSLYQ